MKTAFLKVEKAAELCLAGYSSGSMKVDTVPFWNGSSIIDERLLASAVLFRCMHRLLHRPHCSAVVHRCACISCKSCSETLPCTSHAVDLTVQGRGASRTVPTHQIYRPVEKALAVRELTVRLHQSMFPQPGGAQDPAPLSRVHTRVPANGS